MPKLIIVTGLPGSGKSYYLKQLIKAGEVDSQCVYDDYHANAFRDSSDVVDSRHFCSLVTNLEKGNDCVVSDISFCEKERREAVIATIKERVNNVSVDLRCFENKPEICKQYVRSRARESAEKEISLIDRYTTLYKIPDDGSVTVLKVFESAKE